MAAAPPLGRWGTPPRPVGLSAAAQRFLHDTLGPGGAMPAQQGPRGPVPPTRLAAADLAALAAIVDDGGVTAGEEERLRHAAGSSLLDYLSWRVGSAAAVPDAVVRPRDAQQVQRLLQHCSDSGLAAVPFGGGTSVVGGVTPAGMLGRWISVSLDRMDRVLAVDEVSQTVTVGPGVTGPFLERVLRRRGFTLGHLPQSWERATIGGYVATRSAGQASSGYGRSDDMVESLQVATPRGLLRLGRGPKSAAGPDLRQLFVGSEGALGIITEIALRIRRTPPVHRYEGLMLPTWSRGSAAFRDLAQLRAGADVMRLSDVGETAATLAMSGPQGAARTALDRYLAARGAAGGCLAIMGWEGYSRRAVAARRRAAWSVLRRHGAVPLGRSVGSSWLRHRFDGPYLRDELLDAGYLVETVETAAHWRQLPDLHRRVGDALAGALSAAGRQPHVMCHISHVYETGASLYFTVLVAAGSDPAGQWRSAKKAATDAMVAAGGTITHHHAVGRDHRAWLAAEIGDQGVEILQSVKAAVDPRGVLNPGALIAPVDDQPVPEPG